MKADPDLNIPKRPKIFGQNLSLSLFLKLGSSRGQCLEHVIPAGEVLGEHVVEDDILEILQLIDVPLQGGQPLQAGQAPLQLFYLILSTSVADLDPEDPYVLGPPGFGFGSESISTRYRYGSSSGSRSLYIQAEIVRKTLIPTVLRLLTNGSGPGSDSFLQ